MNEHFKYYAFLFLALRGLIDFALAIVICCQARSLVPGAGFLLICGVFYFFLYFGIKNEGFSGRYGRRVFLWREPAGYWVIVGFLVIFHLFITALIITVIDW